MKLLLNIYTREIGFAFATVYTVHTEKGRRRRIEGYRVTVRSKPKCDPGINQLICLYKNYTYLHKLNSFLCSFVGLLDDNRTTVCGKNYLTLASKVADSGMGFQSQPSINAASNIVIYSEFMVFLYTIIYPIFLL